MGARLEKIKHRLNELDKKITSYFCIHGDILFIKHKPNQDNWKVLIPQTIEKALIMDYHVQYGHMGALKVVKALEEHINIKNINRRVGNYIQTCHVCQLVKCNNERKQGVMIPIESTHKLEKVFLDICGPFPRSGGRHRYKFIVIIFDHLTKFTKLYSINQATTKKILDIVLKQYIPQVGKPISIITDHGTQFKEKDEKIIS